MVDIIGRRNRVIVGAKTHIGDLVIELGQEVDWVEEPQTNFEGFDGRYSWWISQHSVDIARDAMGVLGIKQSPGNPLLLIQTVAGVFSHNGVGSGLGRGEKAPANSEHVIKSILAIPHGLAVEILRATLYATNSHIRTNSNHAHNHLFYADLVGSGKEPIGVLGNLLSQVIVKLINLIDRLLIALFLGATAQVEKAKNITHKIAKVCSTVFL